MIDRSKLRLDPAEHRYYYGDKEVPWSVTKTIRTVLAPMPAGLDPDLMRRAQNWGKAMHSVTKLHDTGRLDMATVHPALLPDLEAWKRCRAEMNMQIHEVEAIVYSELYHFIGTLDRLVEIDRQLHILDIKTGSRMGPEMPVQLSAYRLAAMETITGCRISPRRLVVQLRDGRYTPKWYDNSVGDENIFISALNTIRWRENNGDASQAAAAANITEEYF